MQTTLLPTLALLATLLGPQETKPEEARQPPRFQPPVARPAQPLGADGKPLVPGALPEGTSQAARDAWRGVCAATRMPAELEGLEGLHGSQTLPAPPIRAFDLSFEVVAKTGSAGNNTGDVRFRFLADPGYLRYTLESGREHVRGPNGDWLIAGDKKEKLVGERYAGEDKQQIEQALAIARNFVALTDPAALRIAALAVVQEPPFALPPRLRETAGALDWLDVQSPDFQLVARHDAPDASDPATIFRVLLGHDARGLVRLAIVQRDGGPAALLDPGALLVELRAVEPLDGFMVPRQLVVYEIDEGTRPPAFREREAMDLYRIANEGGLRPHLEPDDFLP